MRGGGSRIDASLGALAAIVGAAAWFHPSASGADLWWHLAAGRHIWETGSLPRTDPFSHTFAGRPWIHHEWLWDALVWPVYQLGPDLLACLNLVVLLAVFALACRLASRTSGSLLAAGAATWLAAAACHWFLDVRPHLTSLLFTLVFLATRERRWAPWTWPPLFVVWVNVHGGFVFGLGAVGLHVLFRTLETSRRSGRLLLPRGDVLGLALAGAATLINPFGAHIFEYPLAYLDSASLFREIIEWHAPVWSIDPRSYAGRFFWLAAVVALGLPRGLRRQPYLVALAAVALAMAITSRRFIPLFAVTSTPVAALGIATAAEHLRAALPTLRSPRTSRRVAIAALAVALALWHDVRFFPQPLYRWTQGEGDPRGALHYLAQLPEPPRRLFNDYSWGGQLMLQARGIPVFIDGRANTLYDEALYRDYLTVYRGGPRAREIVRQYDVDAVLVPTRLPLVRELSEGPNPWRLAYHDPIASLLLPPGPAAGAAPLPDAEAALPNGSALWLLRGYRELRDGDLAAAEKALEQAVAIQPLEAAAHMLLFTVAARRRDREALERYARRAIDLYPRQEKLFRQALSASYAELGDARAALRELRRAVPRGPFSSTAPTLAAIRRLEREAARAPRP